MNSNQRKILLVGIVALLVGAGFLFTMQSENNRSVQTDPVNEPFVASPETDAEVALIPLPEPTDYRNVPVRTASVETIATDFDAPWSFTWLPGGDLLVTERFGTLVRVSADGSRQSVTGTPKVFSAGQGGLLDVTVHPAFAENQWVYLSYATGDAEGNRLEVARGQLRGNTLENLETIFSVGEAKTGSQHFGSRFVWLPDGTLVFSVGDGGNPPLEYNGTLIREQAQDLTAHLGKTIRLNDDGSIPNDNPFVGRPDVNPEIYSFGHRNIQGLAYDTTQDRILASEHGSKGGDEFNEIRPGANYGWPLTTFSTEYDSFSTEIAPNRTLPGVVNPLLVWTPTVAPSEVVVNEGDRYGDQADIFMAAMLLRSNTTIAAYAFRPAGAVLQLTREGEGRLSNSALISLGDVRVRSIELGPDGFLYALTDTTGRQSRPGTNAGAIVRILGWE
jgi:glucose/arabinose dehydrogenase